MFTVPVYSFAYVLQSARTTRNNVKEVTSHTLESLLDHQRSTKGVDLRRWVSLGAGLTP